MPLGEDHYEPVVVQKEATTKPKNTETSTVVGGKAPSGYVDTFVREVPKAAQQAASAVGNALKSAINPIHYKDNGEVDFDATALHSAAELAAAYAASLGIKKAVVGNPLAEQTAATLKVAKMEANTAAAQRAHELELAKLKAAGVVQTAPTAATPTTTTPTVTAPAPTPTPTLAQINAATAAPTTVAPPAGTPPVATPPAAIAPIVPVAAPEVPTVPLTTEVGKAPKEMPMVEQAAGNPEKNALAEGRKQESGSISDGMRNTYNKNTKANPNGPNPLGPKAYNWIAGQEGPKAPEVWKNLVGNKNISYDELQKNVLPLYEAYLGSYGEPDPFASVAKRGTYRTPARIPENIKGNASLGGMGSLAVMAAALGLGGSEKGQAAMAKAAKAIKDIGFSPDILTNKAEEMGRLGTGYVTAGNPVYRKELEQKLQSTNDPQYKKVLQEELDKISSSSNSPYRSVPPPR